MASSLPPQSRPVSHAYHHAAALRRARGPWALALRLTGQAKGRNKGQALVIIALAFVVLLVFVGFVVDVGQLYIYMGHLRRAVDAGSLAAAGQYREGRTIAQMTASAEQVMQLNGITAARVTVHTCNTDPGDPDLCTTPKRKLVRVEGELDSPTSFLALLGFGTIPLRSSAISEAASMDVVLVIDISESMVYDTPVTGHGTDPHICNADNSCQPMLDVKNAAKRFVNRILDQPTAEESDRVALVVFSTGGMTGTRYVIPTGADHHWTSDRVAADAAIDTIRVYEAPPCPFDPYDDPATWSVTGPAQCTSTNVGGGFHRAGLQFTQVERDDALWVTVLLTDGAANASDPPSPASAEFQYGYCPPVDWSATPRTWFRDIDNLDPWCRDPYLVRHPSGDLYYDAADYARDMADYVGCAGTDPAPGCSDTGQGSLIYSIGLGDAVVRPYGHDPVPHGMKLLRYAAAVGDDGDPDTDQCAGLYDTAAEWRQNCGNYYFAATGAQLTQVFEDIYSRMFVRITQ